MKLFLLCLFFAGSTFAAEAPAFPKGALLVFPSQASNGTSTTTTPAPQSDAKGNLEQFNAEIMERLKQETGAEQGVYHVYLPDGRLQKVQYTAAPISQQESAQNVQAPAENENQLQGSGFSVVPKAVYFVQVPADRLQNLKVPKSSEGPNSTKQNNESSTQSPQAQDSPAQYSQQTGSPSQSAQYLPITVLTVDQLSQYRSSPEGNQEQPAFGNLQQDSSNQQSQAFSSNLNQSPAKVLPASADQPQGGYLASVRYSEVQPVTGPVYSYSPLVRILRYVSD